MGKGYIFSCSCRYSKEFHLGGGFAFPNIYRWLINCARRGELGETVKELCEKNSFAAIDADKNLYRCPKCNDLVQEYAMDVYYPLDMEYVTERFEKLNGDPYFTWLDFERYFKLEYKYPHICSKCQETMVMVDTSGQTKIKLDCPQCGKRLRKQELCWD